MKNWMRFFSFLFILNGVILPMIHAQDLTGIWRGHFRSNDAAERVSGRDDDRYKRVTDNYDDRYKMEVQIAQTHNRFQAITYSYKNAEFYGKAEASGTLNPQSKKVLLKEGKLLEVRFASGSVCIMTCFLRYSKLGNDEYLQGTYFSTNVNDSTADCGKGSIFLHRVTETDFYKEPFLEKKEKELLAHKKVAGSGNKSTVKVTPPVDHGVTAKKSPPKTTQVKKAAVSQPVTARRKSIASVPEQGQNTRDSSVKISQPQIPISIPTVLLTRTNELLKTLTVSNTNIELRIYDDGAIDNDTVSVYYDNKILISKARISDQPIIVHITVEPSDHPHQLVMVAENLGDIPPNTSLLVVNDGEKRYEERIISDEQKNIVINFVFKKIE
jgi:hypothetical protein